MTSESPFVGDRFWAKVDKGIFCWEWLGSKSNGYGRFWFEGRLVQAHRWAYETVAGPIPEGLELDHLCRVRHCVNPSHLEPVTHYQNIIRGFPGMPRRAHCPDGHPLSGDNLYVSPKAERHCRACRRAADARRRPRNRKR